MKNKFQGLFLSLTLLLAITSVPFLNSSDEIGFNSAFAVEVGTEVNTEVEIEAEVETEVEVETKAEVEVEVETKAEVETETKTETKNKSETEVKSETKADSKTEATITAETGGEIKSLVQLNIKTSYPKIKTSSDNSFVVQSKQNLYKPGDQIKVEGSVWANLNSEIKGNNMVTVQILDSKGALIKESDIQMEGDGHFEGVIKLPSVSVDGQYLIKSKIKSESSILGTLDSETKAKLESTTNVVVSTPSTVKIKVEGHNDFDVNIASNSKVTNVEFKEPEKKVGFMVEGKTGTKGVSQISIPKALLSGQLSVMLDGKVMAAEDVIVTTNTEAVTTLEINYSHSVHSIEIVGTKAVPEFGAISAVVLAIAIVSIIAISTKSRLSIMPRM